jgi:biotin-dependent carboxylase-like uncharacterized protein
MGRPFLRVLSPGPLTTVQDLGRYGYLKFGLPPSGCADEFAFRAGNVLVGNSPGCAGLEMTILGGKFEFLCDSVFALTGADMEPKINGAPCPMWRSLKAREGDILQLSYAKKGCRGYFLVSGGIDVPIVLKSRSTYLACGLGGFEGRALKAGDALERGEGEAHPGRLIPQKFIPDYPSSLALKVVMGPQEDHFTEEGRAAFLSQPYTVSPQSNRMGYRLSGKAIETLKRGIISDTVPLGAIQVTGEEQPIVLLWDRQTTGGYPKIATVIAADLWKIGQVKPGEVIAFRKVSLEDARSLFRSFCHFLISLEGLIK